MWLACGIVGELFDFISPCHSLSSTADGEFDLPPPVSQGKFFMYSLSTDVAEFCTLQLKELGPFP